MLILSQAISVIIDGGISAPGHGREVLNGLNAIDKRLFLQLMSKVKLTGAKCYDTQMVMHIETRTFDVILSSTTNARKHGVIDKGK